MTEIKTEAQRTKVIVFAGLLLAVIVAVGAISFLFNKQSDDHALDPVKECGVTEQQYKYDSYEPANGGYSVRHYIVRKDPSKPYSDPLNWNGTIEVYNLDGNDSRIECRLIDG